MKNKKNIQNICLLFDTSALSCLFSEKDTVKEYEKERMKKLNILKDEAINFIISSLVLHELVLGITNPSAYENITYKEIIIKKLKNYFSTIKFDDVSISSLDFYKLVYENNNTKSERAKHKFDSLIVASAMTYTETQQKEYAEFILITEDDRMKKYIINSNNLKIMSLTKTLEYLGIDSQLPFEDI